MKNTFDLFAQNELNYQPAEYKHPGLCNNQLVKLKRHGTATVCIDLHGMSTDHAEQSIINCFKQHPENCIIEIIHGIGKLKLQQHIRYFLSNHARCYAYWQPKPNTQATLYCHLITEK